MPLPINQICLCVVCVDPGHCVALAGGFSRNPAAPARKWPTANRTKISSARRTAYCAKNGRIASKTPPSIHLYSRPSERTTGKNYRFAPKASRRPSQSLTTKSRECRGMLVTPRVNSMPWAACCAPRWHRPVDPARSPDIRSQAFLCNR